MPPRTQETPITLYHKILECCEYRRLSDAESALDRADNKNFSNDTHIQVARAMWCAYSFRTEEARCLCKTAIDKIPADITDDAIDLANALGHVCSIIDESGVLRELYNRILPKLPPSSTRIPLEMLAKINAQDKNFKELQRNAQELNKNFKETKYVVWMIFAFLMQIPGDRKSPEQKDSLFYKLALKTMESQIYGKELLVANSNTNSNSNTEQKQNGVAHVYIDILKSQHQFNEALEFLFAHPRGRVFGSWSERVRESADILLLADRKGEANSVLRYLWKNVDSDRWDWFEGYRDTICENIAIYEAPAPSTSSSSTTKKSSKNKKETKKEEHLEADETLTISESGRANSEDLFQDVLSLVEECSKSKPKIRTPRLAAISLLSPNDVEDGGKKSSSSSSSSSSLKELCNTKERKELRKKFISEHVQKIGVEKSLLFFDLVKFINEQDASLFEELKCDVLSGYCRRNEMSKNDEETTKFVNACLSQWKEGDSELDAFSSEPFIIAATSACIRRAKQQKQEEEEESNNNENSNSKCSCWMEKAASIAHHALLRYPTHLPHVAFLSIILHNHIGSSDMQSLKQIDIKSVQLESITTGGFQIAVKNHDISAMKDLMQHAARVHRSLRSDTGSLIKKSLENGTFLKFEEMFEIHDKLMNSAVRVESFAYDTLLSKLMEQDTASSLRTQLLLQRNEMKDIVEKTFSSSSSSSSNASASASASAASSTSTSSTSNIVNLEDREQLFATILHAELKTQEFDQLVDFLLPQVQSLEQRVQQAKNVATVILALEHISGESRTTKSQKSCLKPYEYPSKQLEEICNNNHTNSDNAMMFLWKWTQSLVSSGSVFSKQPKIDRETAISEIKKILSSCQEIVDEFALKIKNSSSSSSSSNEEMKTVFFFPVIQLIVLTTRTLYDRQSNGIKSFISNLKASLGKVKEQLQENISELDSNSTSEKQQVEEKKIKKSLEEICSTNYKNLLLKRKHDKMKNQLSIVDNAITAVGVCEKLSK